MSCEQLAVEFGRSSSSRVETRCARESHTRPKGLGALMNPGPEKMLISCSKDSSRVGPKAPIEHQKNKKDTT